MVWSLTLEGKDDQKSISGLSQNKYLEFLEVFFTLGKQHAKKTTRIAFVNADWRDFQNTPASEQAGKGGILIDDYFKILKKTGWQHTHIILLPVLIAILTCHRL